MLSAHAHKYGDHSLHEVVGELAIQILKSDWTKQVVYISYNTIAKIPYKLLGIVARI